MSDTEGYCQSEGLIEVMDIKRQERTQTLQGHTQKKTDTAGGLCIRIHRSVEFLSEGADYGTGYFIQAVN